MTPPLIVEATAFDELCDHIEQAGLVAFDTEFVSEFTYRPELGLLQFATAERQAAVDPYAVTDLGRWWSIMAGDEVTVVVHGSQAEVRFCRAATGARPQRLVDVQLAEGMRSRSYPLGYGPLVARVLGKRVSGKETRSDWRARPLSPRQIRYALEDVEHVLKIWERQRDALESLGRLSWAEQEFERLIDETIADLERPPWTRLPGWQKLSPRELAVATELAEWREREAERRDRTPRKLLRDDLIIELARRQPRTYRDLMATRDMNRTDYRKSADGFLACIERGLALEEHELPRPEKGASSDARREEQALGQLLGLALSNRSAEVNIARSLLGTTSDLIDLIRWHVFDERDGDPPRLSLGWRAEVCGDLLTDLIDGRIRLRVGDPKSDHPLVFEPVEE